MKLRILLAALLLSLSQPGHAQSCGEYDYYGYLIVCQVLTVSVSASAAGKVTSNPPGISCPGTCSFQFQSGGVTLSATANPGFTFNGWTGDCSGSGTGTCYNNMNVDHSAAAVFVAGSTQAAVVPETGFWYNSAEGGRGYVIEAHSNGNLFIGGFMYDINGNAIWYASGPGAMSSSSYTGQWQQYANGESLTGSYKPSAVSNPAVGSITLQFQTTTTGTLTLPDGRQINIVRFPF